VRNNETSFLIDSPKLARQLLDEFSRIKLSRPELEEGSGVIGQWEKTVLYRMLRHPIMSKSRISDYNDYPAQQAFIQRDPALRE